MKVLWICGLPNVVRQQCCGTDVAPVPTAAWSWILGHLPPPPGVELHIICPVLRLRKEIVEFDYLGAHWHCVRQKNHELLFFWRRVLHVVEPIVNRISPDIIHGWGGETGCGYLATLLSRKAVVSVQGLLALYSALVPETSIKTSFGGKLKKLMTGWIERRSYQRAAICLVESRLAGDALARYYNGIKSTLVPHPLRESFLSATDRLRQPRQGQPKTFLFVGALVKRKGPLDAFDAFCAANISDSRLVVVGDGPLKSVLESAIISKRMQGRIRICSQCTAEEISSLMSTATYFLLPSYGDTGPTALKEALAQGLHPICYDNSGPRELILDYNGTLVKTGDVSALASAIQEVSKLADFEAHKLCERTAALIREDLSPAKAWKRLSQHYRELM